MEELDDTSVAMVGRPSPCPVCESSKRVFMCDTCYENEQAERDRLKAENKRLLNQNTALKKELREKERGAEFVKNEANRLLGENQKMRGALEEALHVCTSDDYGCNVSSFMEIVKILEQALKGEE